MSERSPSIPERLRAARRILFGRGDNAIVCSFCGEDRHGDVRNIVTGPGVAICGKCAQIAGEWCAVASLKPEAGNEIDTFPIFEHPVSLLPSFRADIAEEMERCASALSCKLHGWGYGRGYGELYDALSVFVERPKGTNTAIFRETFIRMLLSRR
ncbi:ClpX C4-type zinc finger protein [Sinorhizobium americanum]|uniref:ATP-dependent Clp protease ATP-binding subunit ClpX zinc ribbon domain-containing protein n=1 Tax=Sinorhizobium americanum TaxID=194963 RepID=A0A1L3LSU8_9HYPH|nr:ClpX C4-type zinc finger protein [Sinorhizobium americanum]APG93116.1 hypothetical protein SAMCFNEI73_pA0139 [Sinorhizobium americanum]OAP49993.1 hypothetical protein ATC00_14795 [Sinorhizobium americanum]